MTQRESTLLFNTLELLRKELRKSDDFRDGDWKDVDDYIFSELDFTVEDLMNLYHGKNQYLYAGSAIEGFAPAGLTYAELSEVMEDMEQEGFTIELREMNTIIGKKLAIVTTEQRPRVLLTSGDTPNMEAFSGNCKRVWLDKPSNADVIVFWGEQPDGNRDVIHITENV